MEEININEFKQFIKKEKTIKEVCEKFNITDFEVWSIIAKLRDSGINITTSGRCENLLIRNLEERFMNNDNEFTLDVGDKEKLSILLLSDTRFGSKYQQLTLTNEAYKNAAVDFDVDFAILLGDISEGLYKKNNEYYNSIFLTDTDSQAENIINNYPNVEGLTTYFITGDQDYTHTTKNGVDIGRMISSERDDMKYLGNKSCLLNLRKLRALLTHLKTGSFDRAKTVSYKQQEYISSLRSEEKFDLMLTGHLLSEDQLNMRNIKEISVPSLVRTTPRIKNYSAVNHNVGYVILDIEFNKSGTLKEVNPTFAPYYQTIPDDYEKAKKLVLTRNEINSLRGSKYGKK